LGEAAEDACGGWLTPTAPFRSGVKNGKVLRMIAHQFAPKFKRVDARVTG
jgi:hypothetical protein